MKSHNSSVLKIYDIIANKYYECRENLALIDEMKIFAGYLPKNASILDAGCGNGRDLEIFHQWGYKISGIDGSKSQLQIGLNRFKKRGIICEIKHGNLLNQTITKKYDGIWCCAVLPHFENHQIVQILKWMSDSIEHDGVIFSSFKLGKGSEYVVEKEFSNLKRFTNYHTLEDVESFVGECGLKIIDVRYYNEQERFSKNNRNIDFLCVFMKKSIG